MEFHISRALRKKLEVDDLLFSYTGNIVFGNVAASRNLAKQLQETRAQGERSSEPINAGALFAMGLIDELNHAMVARYRKEIDPSVLTDAVRWFTSQTTPADVERLLLAFTEQFPNVAVHRGELTTTQWLNGTTDGLPNREAALEELLMLWLANINPAFAPFRELFEDSALKQQTVYQNVTESFPNYFVTRPPLSPEAGSLLDALRAPLLASPDSLTGQLDYIREHWPKYLGQDLRRVLLAIDILREEDLAIWMRFHPPGPDQYRHGAPNRGGEGFVGDEYIGFEDEFFVGPDGVRHRRYASDYQAPLNEYEAFSADQAWMPNVVLMAKSTYVWLEQLSKKYQRHIYRLDQIPDEELQLLADRGITGLWLIGLWERSVASRTIKRLRGHSDAVASAYSLKEYQIADDLGGNAAYENLRDRAARARIRLASDMVPNHMGIDSNWVIDHPDWFLYRWESPFPVYRFEGPDLSTDSRVEIKIEDHYYDQSDAAVVFRLRHHREGTTRYVYHGNDGTTFAWNDTAQLDYSKAAVREHVIQVILHVARLFPIIRFDAAMVLAKRHVQRLWFPLPGAGGSIPSRAENAMTQEEFDSLMPHEFWREVVDRVAAEVPGTLLLAEAFWLLEGYFVRTLGMHRVYNSAFMNMLRDEENAKYRSYLKKTIEFDPDILKRYVSFMSNPDERTAIDQFGSGDKYFGVCTLLATLPGLPMFGHGQIEGYTERYGMEFKQAKMNEYPNDDLVARHQHEIAPLLKNRQLFAESTNFVLYDFWNDHGTVDENVFAYSNRYHGQRAVILYNNSYGSTRGTIHFSAASVDKATGHLRQRSLADGLALPNDGSVFLAYRDTAHGLEYLRRTTDLHHHGLALDLRGYQYAVLLDWRELRSSADQPWDKLHDALNGAGVYNLEEALSKLRLRPLHEALRQALICDNIQAFATAAAETAKKVDYALYKQSPVSAIKDEAVKTSTKASAKIEIKERSTLEAGPSEKAPLSKSGRVHLDPSLQVFLNSSRHFFEEIAEELPPQNDEATEPPISSSSPETSPIAIATTATDTPTIQQLPALVEPAPSVTESIEAKAIAAAQLVALSQTFSSAWPEAVRRVLPNATKPSIHPEQIWAPILAWTILRSVPTQSDRAELFDRLHLRSALSEIFSSVGMEGESTWQAAAKVRVLLAHEDKIPTTLTHTDTFWNDPDVRWLAGINESLDITYFNKERFEELLCWLQLPALIEIAQQNSGKLESISHFEVPIQEASRSAKHAGYKLSEYLSPPSSKGNENPTVGDPKVAATVSADVDLEPVAQTVSTSSNKS
jgi:Alpha amylase, catalytic domain